jgi:hypothetical protein
MGKELWMQKRTKEMQGQQNAGYLGGANASSPSSRLTLPGDLHHLSSSHTIIPSDWVMQLNTRQLLFLQTTAESGKVFVSSASTI